jgi:hypothetical protein
MIGCLIQACQQLSGINFYFSYGSVFARYAGIDDVFIFIIILSAVNVAMSFPGILAVDKMGRRSVLLIGCLVMGVSQVIVGAVSTALPGQAQGEFGSTDDPRSIVMVEADLTVLCFFDSW